MAELVAGAALGIALTSAWNALMKVASSAAANPVFRFAKMCSKLRDDLQVYDPYLKLIFDNIDPAAAREWEEEALLLKKEIDECRELVEKYQHLRDLGGLLKPGKRHHVGKKIGKVREMIKGFMQGTRLVITQIAQLEGRWMSQLEELLAKPEDEEDKAFREMLDEGITEVKEGMTEVKDGIQRIEHGVERNSAMMNALMRKLEVENAACSVPPLPTHLVGLDEHVLQLRSMLLSCGEMNPKMVAIVAEQDGIGKSTLALAVCHDPVVQDFFKQGIHFITVSKNPDLFTLLSTIWIKVTGEELSSLPRFRNLDDAYAQLCHKLADHMQLSPSSKHLLVLDDINSKKSLQKLTFNIPGLWTLVTTRQVDKLNELNTHIYTLECLDLKNARRLFCYFKFGSEDNPSWANERLVEEVISKCKGHPLALKVMSGSVSNVGQHCEEEKTEELESNEEKDLEAITTFVATASSFQVDIEEEKNEELETEEKEVGAKATSVTKESSFQVDIDSSTDTDVGESSFDTNGEKYSKVKNDAYDGERETSGVKESSFLVEGEAPATEEATFDAEISDKRNVRKVQRGWLPAWIWTKKSSSVAVERVEENLASPVDGEEEEAFATEESASEEEEEASATEGKASEEEEEASATEGKASEEEEEASATEETASEDEQEASATEESASEEEEEASATEGKASEEVKEASATQETASEDENEASATQETASEEEEASASEESAFEKDAEASATEETASEEDGWEAFASEESASEEEDEASASED